MFNWFCQYLAGTLPPPGAVERQRGLILQGVIWTVAALFGIGAFIEWTFINPTYLGSALPIIQIVTGFVTLFSLLGSWLFWRLAIRMRRTLRGANPATGS
jgi:hypothetical protein